MTTEPPGSTPSEPRDDDASDVADDTAIDSGVSPETDDGTAGSDIGFVVGTDDDGSAGTEDASDLAEPAAPSRRRRTTIIVAVVAAVAVLAGVGIGLLVRGDSSKSEDAGTVKTRTTSLDKVTVSGEPGQKPTVTFNPAFVGTEETFRVISEGDGPVVEDGQRVSLDYVAISGADGSELDSTYGQATQAVTASSKSLTPALANALIGQKVGSRVMVSADQTQAQTGAWVIFVFDIRSADTLPTSASGTPQAPQAGFPTITVENGVPKIATPTGNPPNTLSTEVLIKGDGPAITAGQTVTMQYTGIIWATGKEFDSSWGGDPVDFPVGTGQVIAGFDEGLVGQTVGSRVVLVIPPDKGYGTSGNSSAGISGTDTLVFVVDLLAAS